MQTALGVEISVIRLTTVVQTFMSQLLDGLLKNVCTDSHLPQMLNPDNFGDP